MRFMSTWKDPNSERLVYFAPEVIAVFGQYVQGDQDAEAGGILLGHVRGIHLEILEATVPTPKDRRLKYFLSDCSTAIKVLQNADGEKAVG